MPFSFELRKALYRYTREMQPHLRPPPLLLHLLCAFYDQVDSALRFGVVNAWKSSHERQAYERWKK